MKNKINEKISFSRYLACLAGICLLLTGCATLRSIGPRAEPKKTGLEIHAQYAVSSDPKLGYNTFEVYIANYTDNTITFTGLPTIASGATAGAELNGKPLPKFQSKEISKMFAVKLAEGDEIPLTEPGFPEDSPVTWWQYYPCNEVKPGETIEFQVNFKAMPTGRQTLCLLYGRARAAGLSSTALATEGPAVQNVEPIVISVPRFRQPDKRLTAITYSLDGKRMFVQYASRKVALKKLFVNGQNVRKFKILQSVEGNTPDLVALDAPFELKTGDVLHVQAEFADGSRRDALIRVLKGIVLDGAFKGGSDEQALRKEYSLDEYSVVEMLPFDVACGDTKAGKHGMSAPTVTEKRGELYRMKPDRLDSLAYCTAMYPALWNIYGQIADAVFAKPYRLHWGRNPMRFIEEEEACIEKTQETSMPKPFLYIPERFKKERYMEAEELNVLVWMVLAKGAKGIRYHYWMNPWTTPFEECPGLGAEVKILNAQIKNLEEKLAPLVLVKEWVDDKNRVKVYGGWSGDQGMLILVRNLDYRTDRQSNNREQSLRFQVKSKKNIGLEIAIPNSFKPGVAQELLTGGAINSTLADGKIKLTIPEMKSFSAIWIENKR